MLKIISTVILALVSATIMATTVYPPNWWVGMKNGEVQLMVHGDDIGLTTAAIDYPGVNLLRSTTVENANYIFLDISIDSGTTPGKIPIRFSREGRPEVVYYELKERKERSLNYGLQGSDFIYLIMPDRFVNGDQSNDILKEMKDQNLNRGYNNRRHGGDLQGVISKLDYLQELGVTATWLTPPLENDQPLYSYHGYAMTNHFAIDPRIGTNDLYRTYVQESHKRGMQVVFDVVLNHVGDQHAFIQDLPSSDWVNQWESFTRTNYRTSALMDMYASDTDKKKMTDGWFDTQMPDLNQRNPLVANYLIQWCIWWIEEMQVDAFRLDTYSYGDQDFLTEWAIAINTEYPGFTEFAEVWVNGKGVQGYYNGNNNLKTDVNTHLDGVLDFDLYWGFIKSLTEPFGWEHGTGNLYLRLVQDYMYGDDGGMANVTFLGNHDIDRFYSMAQEDLRKYKIGVTLLMTMRGVPQWFYGDEVLLTNFANPMDTVRIDFPGGWQGDPRDLFKKDWRSAEEQEAFSYLQKIANWRKQQEVFNSGGLKHFVPEDNIYVYFRYNADESVMVIINTSEREKTINTDRYQEGLQGYSAGTEIISGSKISSLDTLTIPAMSSMILDLEH